MQKIKRSIDFTKPQMTYLKREAKRRGISVGELVRWFVDKAAYSSQDLNLNNGTDLFNKERRDQ